MANNVYDSVYIPSDLQTEALRDYYVAQPDEVFLGERFFPNFGKIEDLDVKYLQGINEKAVEIANVHAFNATIEQKSLPPFDIAKQKLLKIAQRYPLNEEEIIRLNSLQSKPNIFSREIDIIYDVITRGRRAVLSRIELMRNQALAFGKLDLIGNEVHGRVGYLTAEHNRYSVTGTDQLGTPITQNLPGGKAWSDPEADILGDIQKMKFNLRSKGVTGKPTIAVTSQTVLTHILNNNKVRRAFLGVQADMIITEDFLNEKMRSLGLPEIVIYDEMYYVMNNENQEMEGKRFFPEDMFVMFDETKKLGETIFAKTSEEIRFAQSTGVQFTETDYVISLTISDDINRKIYTDSVAIAIPTFPRSHEIVQAVVIDLGLEPRGFSTATVPKPPKKNRVTKTPPSGDISSFMNN